MTSSAVGRLTRTALGGWWVLTVLGQKLYRPPGRPSRWDRLHLVIPDWRFFAPDPGVHDHHCLVRDVLIDGGSTDWQEITEVAERRWTHALWHPHRRVEKMAFDLSAELLRWIEAHPHPDGPEHGADPAVQLTVPYLTILSHITARPHGPTARATQFLIAVSGGYDEAEEPTMVFLSAVHPLPGASADQGKRP